MTYEVETEKQEPVQNWAQSETFKFKGVTETEGYQLARAKFDTLDVERKRIRRRPDGSFDVVVYAPVAKKTKKRKAASDEAPDQENLG